MKRKLQQSTGDGFGKCEVCGERATHTIYDCIESIQPSGVISRIEDGEHHFCSAHKRKQRIRQFR